MEHVPDFIKFSLMCHRIMGQKICRSPQLPLRGVALRSGLQKYQFRISGTSMGVIRGVLKRLTNRLHLTKNA